MSSTKTTATAVTLSDEQLETVTDALHHLAAHHADNEAWYGASYCLDLAAQITTAAASTVLVCCTDCHRPGLPLEAGRCLSCRNDAAAEQTRRDNMQRMNEELAVLVDWIEANR